MRLVNMIAEDFTNYKVCSMFLGFPSCTWKCERDCGRTGLCQNAILARSPSVWVPIEHIINTYTENPLSKAIVCGGLEPFDSWSELLELVSEFRKVTEDPVIIYTGYYKDEIRKQVKELQKYPNIIIKFGRFVPDQESHYDEVLGVKLASDNQYAERIS